MVTIKSPVDPLMTVANDQPFDLYMKVKMRK